MFKDWNFLIGEMFVLLLLAALLGLLVGWIIWGRRTQVVTQSQTNLRPENETSAKDLEAFRAEVAAKDAQIGELEASLKNCEIRVRDLKADLSAHEDMSLEEAQNKDFDGDGILEGTDEGSKPTTLEAARGGLADDLKMIKGIGPKLEQLCNSLGFFHFDQIAAWTDQDVAWVDANLEGFKGRVSRDNWVEQAKTLAAGGSTEFADRVKGGGVYE